MPAVTSIPDVGSDGLPLTDIFFCLTYIVYSFGKIKHFAYLTTLIFTNMLAETHGFFLVLRGVDLILFLLVFF